MLTIRRGAPTRRMTAVGGRDDRAEDEGHRPGQVDQLVGDHSDGPGGRDHQPDRRQRDHPRVRSQGAQVHEEGRRVEQRRQEDEQNQVGLELDVRDPGRQAQQEPAEHERNRIGHPQPVGESVQARGRHEECRNDDLQVAHAPDCRALRRERGPPDAVPLWHGRLTPPRSTLASIGLAECCAPAPNEQRRHRCRSQPTTPSSTSSGR